MATGTRSIEKDIKNKYVEQAMSIVVDSIEKKMDDMFDRMASTNTETSLEDFSRIDHMIAQRCGGVSAAEPDLGKLSEKPSAELPPAPELLDLPGNGSDGAAEEDKEEGFKMETGEPPPVSEFAGLP
ncbi:unnamed protein product, partial [Prorocentrum cordatum]